MCVILTASGRDRVHFIPVFRGYSKQNSLHTCSYIYTLNRGYRVKKRAVERDLVVHRRLKQAVIQLFLDNFKVLATHPSQYGETEVLEMKINLIPGVNPYKSRVRPLNPDQKENLRDQIDEWLEQGVIEPSISPWASPLVPVKKK